MAFHIKFKCANSAMPFPSTIVAMAARLPCSKNAITLTFVMTSRRRRRIMLRRRRCLRQRWTHRQADRQTHTHTRTHRNKQHTRMRQVYTRFHTRFPQGFQLGDGRFPTGGFCGFQLGFPVWVVQKFPTGVKVSDCALFPSADPSSNPSANHHVLYFTS
jgi:hypothetical protein